jgi:peptidyl-tRNA hydrolase
MKKSHLPVIKVTHSVEFDRKVRQIPPGIMTRIAVSRRSAAVTSVPV